MMGANSPWGKTGIIWKDSWYNVKKKENIIFTNAYEIFHFFSKQFSTK